jgi:hypothetical protein
VVQKINVETLKLHMNFLKPQVQATQIKTGCPKYMVVCRASWHANLEGQRGMERERE